jgi:hypothetical protein
MLTLMPYTYGCIMPLNYLLLDGDGRNWNRRLSVMSVPPSLYENVYKALLMQYFFRPKIKSRL